MICRKCHRPLRNPKSVVNEMGPVCYAKSQWEKTADGNQQTLLDIPGDDVVLRRGASGIATNIPHRLVRHSPTGLEWGYGGSGPADLALNILLKYGVAQEWAERWHQDFKWAFVSKVPREGGTIHGAEIRAWIQEKAVAGGLL